MPGPLEETNWTRGVWKEFQRISDDETSKAMRWIIWHSHELAAYSFSENQFILNRSRTFFVNDWFRLDLASCRSVRLD